MNADEALRFIEELILSSGAKPLNDLQRAIFRGAWVGKDYKEIHQDCGHVGLDHVKRNVGPRLWKQLTKLVSDHLGEPIEVRKEALQGPIERLRDRLLPAKRTLPEGDSFSASPQTNDESSEFNSLDKIWQSRRINRKQDWGQAPDTSSFQGRRQDLQLLEQWVQEDGCRLIALVGTAGIGKTDLAVKLTEELRDRFDQVIWRSLDPNLTGQPAPPLSELLADLIHVLNDTNLPAPSTLTNFLKCLREQRCLIVLDGFEAVLQSQVLSGDYYPGYEPYGDLLKRISDVQHQSCLLITTREKPREIEAREGEKAPVRSFLVSGLTPEDIQELFLMRGDFSATVHDWLSLSLQYDGNPRFLQQIATTIANAFGHDVSHFLRYQQGKAIFVGEIRRSLEHQIQRLSIAELRLIQQLAQHDGSATLEEIQQFANGSVSGHDLLELLLSLVRRSLLKNRATLYSLHSLFVEFTDDSLVVT